MKTLKVEFTEAEENKIFDKLIKKFDKNNSSKQFIEFELDTDEVIESMLELYIEHSDFDENHQNEIISRGVIKFCLTFLIDGEEVEVEDWNIDDRISNHYHI